MKLSCGVCTHCSGPLHLTASGVIPPLMILCRVRSCALRSTLRPLTSWVLVWPGGRNISFSGRISDRPSTNRGMCRGLCGEGGQSSSPSRVQRHKKALYVTGGVVLFAGGFVSAQRTKQKSCSTVPQKKVHLDYWEVLGSWVRGTPVPPRPSHSVFSHVTRRKKLCPLPHVLFCRIRFA